MNLPLEWQAVIRRLLQLAQTMREGVLTIRVKEGRPTLEEPGSPKPAADDLSAYRVRDLDDLP